jgi:hypothetical protein
MEGVVHRIGTEEPIVGAEVTVTRSAGNGPRASIAPATTDGSGRFTFKELEAGSYRLSVVSNGYSRQDFGQRIPGMAGAPIVLADGQDLKGISIPMTPAGSLSGHLRNSRNRPLVGIPLQLMRSAFDSSGDRYFQPVSSTRSNDLGEYRFYWMTPGRYFVMAGQGPLSSRRGSSIRTDESENEVVEEYPYTYFPGTIQIEKAIAVEIKPGTSVDGVDWTLDTPRSFRISARVVEAATGLPPQRAAVTLSYWRGALTSTGFYDAKTGILEFKGVVPGAYNVSITAFDGPGMPTTVSSRSAPGASAEAGVVLSNSDIDLGVLTMVQPVSIQGRVVFEGVPDASTPQNSLQIRLVPPPDVRRMSLESITQIIRTFVKADGTLTANYPYESLRVSVSGLPIGFYVREARLDSADALEKFATVSGPGELTIVLSSKGGRVSGVVRDARMQPVAGVQTVLVPNGKRSMPELFKVAVSDQEGRYEIAGIPPGEYTAFAWEALEPNSFFDPEVLQKYEQRGQPVHVAESSNESLVVKMIPAEGE